jgi:acyl CoA:acetate/3-ketoacid CoA transferase beta subunit
MPARAKPVTDVDKSERTVARVALDLRDDFCVNLEIDMPRLIANHDLSETEVVLRIEYDIPGMGSNPIEGQEAAALINAIGETTSEIPETVFYSVLIPSP